MLLGLLAFLSWSAATSYTLESTETTLINPNPVVNINKLLGFSTAPQDRSEIDTLIQGILNSKNIDKVWFQCGERVPKKDWHYRAEEVARACIYSAKLYGIDPVGQLATWQQESRLDPCAIGPSARNFAIRNKIIPKKRTISYTKDQVLAILDHQKFKASFKTVDLGIAQLLYPWFTGSFSKEDILSLGPGSLASAQELARRGQRWKTDEPWITWPGKPSKARKAKINWWVHSIMKIEFFK